MAAIFWLLKTEEAESPNAFSTLLFQIAIPNITMKNKAVAYNQLSWLRSHLLIPNIWKYRYSEAQHTWDYNKIVLDCKQNSRKDGKVRKMAFILFFFLSARSIFVSTLTKLFEYSFLLLIGLLVLFLNQVLSVQVAEWMLLYMYYHNSSTTIIKSE